MKQLTISQTGSRLIYLSLVYVAFILPFHGPHIPVGIGVGLATLGWLLEGKLLEKFRSLLQNKFALLFISLYLAYLLSTIYSQNKTQAGFDAQLKLSLLLFPLVLGTAIELNRKHCITILKAFVIGCLVSIALCLIHATYYTQTTEENHFLYDKLSIFVQVGYYAMYLTLAAILIVFDWTTRVKSFSLLHLTALLAISIMLVLLSARAQLLAFLLILPVFGYIFLKERIGQLKALVITLGSIIGFILIMAAQPETRTRIESIYTDFTKKDIDRHSPYLHGLNTRLLLWEIGRNIIAENPLIGVGVGDVEDELLFRAKAQDYPAIFNKELNFHNQFYQTAVGIGLVGLLIFLAHLIWPMVVAAKENMTVYMAFVALIIISALTESIFERQAGVIFFAFFNSLLFLKRPELIALR